jgi:NAD(P)H dehydrogenase (quinone)
MLAITGASGKLGRSVAAELLRRTSAATVRLGTRSPDKLASFGETGAAIVAADFEDRSSLERLFNGCSAGLIISGDAPNAQRIRQHSAVFEVAKSVGVGRIVYTSFANPSPQSHFLVAPSHVESERMLRGLGVPFTILRNGLYCENIMIEAARATGELVQPHSDGRAAYIGYADVARATAGALLGDGHENRTYEITGPEAFNHFEIAERLSAAWGRPIRVRNVAPEAYAEGLRGRGLPPFIVELLVSLHAAIGAGEYAPVSSDAEMLAGRSIESMSAFLARA